MSSSQVIAGLHLIGSTFPSTSNMEQVPFILMGEHDEMLLAAFTHLERNMHPDASEEEVNAQAQTFIERYKQVMRNDLKHLFNEAVEQDVREERKKKEREEAALRKTVVDSSAPSNYGTVSEIAEKLGISKSEVRRHKREGTLDSLFAQV